MKKIIIAFAILSQITAFAQKEKEEEIVYYTDSDVKHQKFYIGGTYSPYYVNRRILSEAIGTDQATNFLNQGTKGDFGYSVGGDIYYKLNSSSHLSIGVNKSYASYSIDFKKVADDIWGVGDTINGNWNSNTHVEYLNIPLQWLFTIPLSDEWDGEVAPMVEANIGTYMSRDLNVPEGYEDITNPEDAYWNVTKDNMRDVNWTIGVGLGTNYYITPKFSFFMRAHVKYMLRPIVANESPSEVLLWLGGQVGLRLYL